MCRVGWTFDSASPCPCPDIRVQLSIQQASVNPGTRPVGTIGKIGVIDPLQSVAFAVQTHPGVYALLIGSGVSRAAGVPTGWEIVLDLIGKLAAASGETVEPNPEQWYLEKYREAPDYSKLLDLLAKTPTERQQLLHPYFEPTVQEREDGLKLPTAAHKAIAQMVREGFVRVIITTNFDRLLEKALEAEGVEPEVISSPEQLKGALPLAHVRCRVFKVHGDYQDPRIRNTLEELSNYLQEVDEHLDRIFDEFGLVVCGWSAEWDIALRNAILRTPSRRFTTYWATFGQVNNAAQRLIDHRRAEVVPIEDADQFFFKVQETVESIQEFSRPHPLSIEAAVASLKRYLPNPEHRIRFVDLVDATVEQVINATSGDGFELLGAPEPTLELMSSRLRHYESACSTLLAMAPIGGFWAEDAHYYAWSRALERLITAPRVVGRHYEAWAAASIHPARVLLYALGMGAVESGRLNFLSQVFKTTVNHNAGAGQLATVLTTLFNVRITRTFPWDELLEGRKGRTVPLSDWVHDALRPSLNSLVPMDDKYTFIFDELEILIALGFGALELPRGNYWAPVGAFIYRSQNRERILANFTDSISDLGVESPLVQSGIFGASPEACCESLEKLESFVPAVASERGIF